MTVKELIDRLQHFNPELQVAVRREDDEYTMEYTTFPADRYLGVYTAEFEQHPDVAARHGGCAIQNGERVMVIDF